MCIRDRPLAMDYKVSIGPEKTSYVNIEIIFEHNATSPSNIEEVYSTMREIAFTLFLFYEIGVHYLNTYKLEAEVKLVEDMIFLMEASNKMEVEMKKLIGEFAHGALKNRSELKQLLNKVKAFEETNNIAKKFESGICDIKRLQEILAHNNVSREEQSREEQKCFAYKEEVKCDSCSSEVNLSLIHICRCRRYAVCRSRWSPYH
eukprot:TRINITY_DN21468_c0_g1_i1.p1 TRINITY_DN21468_c0_g1~~TRINITY_DN21468_c0_g1_i1.p1  ORF type:complete len:204 (+),score=22.21 TRINITY_DN21468_c0_g1_i1:75-686(+)